MARLIKEFRNFLVASNLWVGLSMGALAWLQFPNMLGLPAMLYALSLMWATAAAYLYIRLVQRNYTDSSSSHLAQLYVREWPQGIAVLALLFALSAGWIWWRLFTTAQWWLLGPAALIVFLYPLKVKLPLNAFTSLRTLPGLKILLIGIVWTLLGAVMPALLSGAAWDAVLLLRIGVVFLLVVAITIPFDVRDLLADAQHLRTLPQVLGTKGALQLAHFLLLIAQLLVVVQYLWLEYRIELALGWLVGLEIGQQLVGYCKNTHRELFVSFWVEAIPILLFLCVFISRLWLGSLYF